MHDLISETCRKVEQWLGQCANPCVLWSGGKDSTAMLHLIRHEVGAKLPCVQWREPRFRSRYAHSDRLAAEWDLEVYDWTPLAYALTDGYDIETGQPRFDFREVLRDGAAQGDVFVPRH
jgi:3'-phosphoadenosine 5'-phosphosulfate sulfotransferase (PAPS reductase)/FAD synthetase